MNRGKGMATGREAMARKAAKDARPKPLVPKATGARLVDKRAWLYSEAHLKLVRAQPCIVSRSLAGVVAHHPDECFPHLIAQQMKITDFLAVPIRHDLHDPGHPGALHKSNNYSWWMGKRKNPYIWLRGFLRCHYPIDHAGAAYAIEQINIIEERGFSG